MAWAWAAGFTLFAVLCVGLGRGGVPTARGQVVAVERALLLANGPAGPRALVGGLRAGIILEAEAAPREKRSQYNSSHRPNGRPALSAAQGGG